MQQSVHENHHFESPEIRSSGKLPFWRFLFRYPVFLLAFGPPIFRSGTVDATKGSFDAWTAIQVGLIGLIAFRASMRLLSAHEILVPRQIRSILRLFFILGLLFMASTIYSPSRFVSAAYAFLYLLTVICVVEFVIDAYRHPPYWVQCLMHLRMILFLLFILTLCTLLFNPLMVMTYMPGVGVRLVGGAVAPFPIICPLIAIISAYFFLSSLESKARSVSFFLIGLAGTLITQARGAEIGLLVSLALVGCIWAGTGRRRSYLFLATSFATVLLGSAALAVVGGGRVWSFFNRGQDIETIESASGRTQVWKFVIHYCMSHPQGMGYIAGFKVKFREYFTLGLQVDVSRIGNTHNAFIDVLAGAGWAALAVYLYLLFKIITLAWRGARRRAIFSTASEDNARHALRCVLVMLVFCMIGGLDAADFSVPMRAAFYLQKILIAMILGISARMLNASRARPIAPAA